MPKSKYKKPKKSIKKTKKKSSPKKPKLGMKWGSTGKVRK